MNDLGGYEEEEWLSKFFYFKSKRKFAFSYANSDAHSNADFPKIGNGILVPLPETLRKF